MKKIILLAAVGLFSTGLVYADCGKKGKCKKKIAPKLVKRRQEKCCKRSISIYRKNVIQRTSAQEVFYLYSEPTLYYKLFLLFAHASTLS